MPAYKEATFTLHSVDHNRVLLNQEVTSITELLGTDQVHEAPEQLNLKFELEGETFETTLFKGEGAIKNSAKIIKVVNGEMVESPLEHPVHSYKSEDRRWRFNFVHEKRAEGLVTKEDGLKYHFVIEDGKMKVDTNVNSYFAGSKFEKKGLRNLSEDRELMAFDHWDNCHTGQNVAGLTSTSMGAAIGSQMFAAYGQATSTNMINTYIDLSNDIYENQMDVTLEVQTVFVSETSSSAPFNSPSCRISISNQLNLIRTWSKPSSDALWHLFDDCFGFSGSTLGIAYLGALCESFNVGVSYLSEGRISTVDYPTWTTVAHEIGHNFDAQHSFEEGQGRTGGIMDYGPANSKLIDGTMQFNSKYRETEVCNFVDVKVRSGCLTSAAEIKTVSVRDTNQSKNVVDCQSHRNRVFAADSSKVLEKVVGVTAAECDVACASGIECAGYTVSADTGLCKLYKSVSESDMKYALGFESSICASNSRSADSVHTKTVDDILGELDAEVLRDACCSVSEKMGFLGMNEAALTGMSLASCEAACVQSTHCTNAVYMIGGDCLFFGESEVDAASIKVHHDPSMTTISCDRTCLNDIAMGGNESSSNLGTAVGATFGVAAAVAAVGAIYYFTKSKKN